MNWDREEMHLVDAGRENDAQKFSIYMGPKAERGEWVKVGELVIPDLWSRVDGCLSFSPKTIDVKELKKRFKSAVPEFVTDMNQDCINAVCPEHCGAGESPSVYAWNDKNGERFEGYFHGTLACPAANIYRMQGRTAL